MKRLFAYVLLALAVVVYAGVPAHAQTKSLRHLVYSFSFGQQGDQHRQNLQYGSADLGGSTSDKGTITADVMGIQPDHGLVVSVTEAGQNGRNAAADTCVVFADTITTCQNPQGVTPEELAIVRLLAPHFYDPTQLDAKQHWHEGGVGKDGSTSIDFTVTKNQSGMLTISEHRTVVQKGIQATNINADSTIHYDVQHFVPTAVKEYSTMRQQRPTGGYLDENTDIEIQLQSDSMNKN